jgi:hypothetical protein
MAAKLQLQDYALIARCLRGEASAQDNILCSELLKSDAGMSEHYERLKLMFHKSVPPASAHEAVAEADYLRQKFDQITNKLKAEGTL